MARLRTAAMLSLVFAIPASAQQDVQVGPGKQGGYVVATRQLIHPAGRSVEWHGRPTDLVVSPDGRYVYVKNYGSVLTIDAATWKIADELKLPAKASGSMTGLTLSPDGKRLWVTASESLLLEGVIAADGKVSWGRKVDVSAMSAKGSRRGSDSYPCGVAISPDGTQAYVCQSIANAVAVVDLAAGKSVRTIQVGNAPWGVVLSADGTRAYVTNWGGRRATAADKTNNSAGTPIVVDAQGLPSTGTVSVLDTKTSKSLAEIPVGLHPGAVLLSPDGKTLYVANASSDSVSVIDTATNQVTRTLDVKPDAKLPWGSCPTGLCISPDAQTLYVTLGGNNAVAVIPLATGDLQPATSLIPAGWFPGAVATDGKSLLVVNVKGVGSRDPGAKGKWNSHSYWGSINQLPIPDAAGLKTYTAQATADALIPQVLRSWEKSQSDAKPAPVPAHVGEPSPIEHVLYVIKENRTYDQILGDVGKGNSDPKLCTFGKDVTPNHHALAEQFVLLDNFYCNGVNSADGHAWVTEGFANDYLEKSQGSFSRSYPFSGDDAMAFAPTGFIWDNALLHGLSFRNFGEFSKTEVVPTSSAASTYKDYLSGARVLKYKNTMALEPLRKYTNPDAAGWSLRIPDQQRADCFLKELKESEDGTRPFPNFTILYLPSDHTSGTSPGGVSPAAMVADNDLAVGRVVDAVSHSKFWPTTAIFVIEDDPQAGFDHVDGHRSLCLVASPYTKRGAIVNKFYNQTSVLHTMELILGLPPMNQMDSLAPAMRDAFTDHADLTPYTFVKNVTPLDETNPAKADISGRQFDMAKLSEKQNFDEPDRANEDDLNRIVWYAQMGYKSKYPSSLAGAHGKGLKKLGLKLDGSVKDDDD